MSKVYAIGAGMTRFGKYNGKQLPWKSLYELGGEAVIDAMKDAGVGPKDINVAYCGNNMGLPNCGQTILDDVGLMGPEGMPVYNHENACCSSLAALRQAFHDLSNDIYDVAIVVGAEKMTAFMGAGLGPLPDFMTSSKGAGGGGSGGAMVGSAIQVPEGKMFLADVGVLFTSFFAMTTRRHMYEFGTTMEQIAQVSVKNHKHGAMNPYASYQKELTMEEILNSRIVCDPVHVLEICPATDGGAAVILANEKAARRFTSHPVELRAVTLSGPIYKGKKTPNCIMASKVATKQAYEESGLGPEDIDMVEMHDDSAAFEIFTIEDLGFCEMGGGGPFVAEGRSGHGGDVVFSPSGGLLAKGHPLGATGCAQLFEIYHQLRGDCGKRQVEGAKAGLIHNGGGIANALEPQVMCIAILTK